MALQDNEQFSRSAQIMAYEYRAGRIPVLQLVEKG